jgi:hypothetical protein
VIPQHLKTNPINRDTDNDGLWDGDEFSPGTIDRDGIPNPHKWITDPTLQDTDNDGLWDGIEIAQKNLKLDPNPDTAPSVDLGIPGGLGNEANPLVRDIYIEVDWMRGKDKDNHDVDGGHELPAKSKEFMIALFARHEINLHIDYKETASSNSIAHLPDTIFDDDCRRPTQALNCIAYFNYDAPYSGFNTERIGVFHYAIIAHDSIEKGSFVSGVGGVPRHEAPEYTCDHAHTLKGCPGFSDTMIIFHGTIMGFTYPYPVDKEIFLGGTFAHELMHNLISKVSYPDATDQYPSDPFHDKYHGFLFLPRPDNQIKEDWFAIDFHPHRWIEIAIEGIGRGLPERAP